MTEEVNFGRNRTVVLDPAHEEVKQILEAGLEACGDDVLTEWEEDFVEQSLKGIKARGNDWTLSDGRNGAIQRIRDKLKAENLL